jgi:hypothetical protein
MKAEKSRQNRANTNSNPMAGVGSSNPLAGGGDGTKNPLKRLQGAALKVKQQVAVAHAFHAKPTKKLTPADLKTLIDFMDEDRTTKEERLGSLNSAAAMYLFTCAQLVELLNCIGIKSGVCPLVSPLRAPSCLLLPFLLSSQSSPFFVGVPRFTDPMPCSPLH